MRNFLSLFLFACASVLGLRAQSQPQPDYIVIMTPEKKPEPSLAEQAKKAQKPTTAKAKIVFTNDNLHKEGQNPFPMVRLEQDDSEAIVKSMIDYRYGHTAKETEDAIHKWYDFHYERLADMKNEATQIRERQSNRYSYQEQPRTQEDYKRIVARQRSDMLTMQNDQQIMASNSKLTQRIYMTLQKVNMGLRKANLNYEWFVMKNMYDDYYY
jgi:hypothetical protein